MKIETILDLIDLGEISLPEFQRGYVWNRDQVRGFIQSLYRRYPVGSLLIWTTKRESAPLRGEADRQPDKVKLLLDGQQRITTLYGIIRGKPPRFFEGNAQAFTGLYFNLETEEFQFYMPTKMQDNPLWISVTDLMKNGIVNFLSIINQLQLPNDKIQLYIKRLNTIEQIKQIDLYAEEITGEDKTVDIVVDIFNRVNSGGTKLSKGDLALAKICADWPEARTEMRKRLETWKKAGFSFHMDWLLRNITTIITGEAFFSALKDVTSVQFQEGLMKAEKAINYLLNMISGRLGLDHGQVLGSVYSFPLMSRYICQKGGKLLDSKEQSKLLYWYIHTLMWGRYAGSTESVLNQDLKAIEDPEYGLDRLIELMRRSRGDLTIRPEDFDNWSRGARFYSVLYMLTRVCGARDWGTGLELSRNLLGKLNSLQVHHIFPKALLKKHGYSRPEINALANFCFLTQDTNLRISNRPPSEYFEEIMEKHPGALESQWIPMDKELWKVENYLRFLEERRKLLAEATNRFLNELFAGSSSLDEDFSEELKVESISVSDRALDPELKGLMEWLQKHRLPLPELHKEIVHPETEQVLTVVDAIWPDGIQKGLSNPAVFLLEEDREQILLLQKAGFEVYTSIKELRDVFKKLINVEAKETDLPWLDIVHPDYQGLALQLVKAGVPVPEVGYEFKEGIEIVGEAELAWPKERICILTEAQRASLEAIQRLGWKVWDVSPEDVKRDDVDWKAEWNKQVRVFA